MVICEIIFTTISGCMGALDGSIEIREQIPCIALYAVYGPVACSAVILMVCRVSFLYGNLVQKESKYAIRKVFWRNNLLKRQNLIIIIVFVSVLSWVNVIGYFIAINHFGGPTRETCDSESLYFAQCILVISIMILIVYCVNIIRHRIFDKIGMSLEMLLYSLTLVIIVVVSYATNKDISSLAVYLMSIVGILYTGYYPMLVMIYHNYKKTNNSHKTSAKSEEISLLDERVQVLCKKFMCEENSFFLVKLFEYREGLFLFENLTALFIENGASFELNISTNIRLAVLNSVTIEEKTAALRNVELEVIQMIRENVMPYLYENK